MSGLRKQEGVELDTRKADAFDGNMENSSIITGRQVGYMGTEADGWTYMVLGMCRSSILIASVF